jgi:hypothetical protein
MTKVFLPLGRSPLPFEQGTEELEAPQGTPKLMGNLGDHLSHGPKATVPGDLLLHFLETRGVGKDEDISDLLPLRPLDRPTNGHPGPTAMVKGHRDLPETLL